MEEEGDGTERKFITETKCDERKTAKLRYTCHFSCDHCWGRRDSSLLAQLSLVPLAGATCEGSGRESFCCGWITALTSQLELRPRVGSPITFYRAQPEFHFFREIMIWTVGLDKT